MQCLGASPKVSARVLHRASGATETFFTGFETGRQADGWKSGQGDGAAGNAAATIDHLKSNPVGNAISLGFVQLDHYFGIGLSGNRRDRINARPVNNTYRLQLPL